MKWCKTIVFAGVYAILNLGAYAQEPLKNVMKEDGFPPVKELPGGPENAPSTLSIGEEGRSFVLSYNRNSIAEAFCSASAVISSETEGTDIVEQRIKLITEFHGIKNT